MTQPNYVMDAQITRVIDGDTVVATVSPGFKIQLVGLKFRLHGINTAELKAKTESQKTSATAAKDYVRAAVENKKVFIKTIKTKAGSDLIDSFGRYLAVIFYETKDGQVNLNEELLQKGLAVIYEDN